MKSNKLLDINRIIEEVKYKGIIRKLDKLGRFVIPIKFRDKYGFNKETLVTFEKIKDCIICRKVTDNYDGIARKLDALGRPVVPKEYRQELEWKEGDFIGIYVYKDFLIFRKLNTKCIFCYEERKLIEFEGKYICKKCMNKIINEVQWG